MEPSVALEHIVIAVKKVAPFEVAAMTPQTRIVEELGLDSTGILELLLELEQSIGFEADMEELWPETFQTLGALAEYVAQAATVAEAG